MSKDLLLEIGTEEIPAHYMPSALKQLHEGAADIFAKNHLDYKAIRTVGTPRRLALLVTGLAEKQADVSSKNKGPSVKMMPTATRLRPLWDLHEDSISTYRNWLRKTAMYMQM